MQDISSQRNTRPPTDLGYLVAEHRCHPGEFYLVGAKLGVKIPHFTWPHMITTCGNFGSFKLVRSDQTERSLDGKATGGGTA